MLVSIVYCSVGGTQGDITQVLKKASFASLSFENITQGKCWVCVFAVCHKYKHKGKIFDN